MIRTALARWRWSGWRPGTSSHGSTALSAPRAKGSSSAIPAQHRLGGCGGRIGLPRGMEGLEGPARRGGVPRGPQCAIRRAGALGLLPVGSTETTTPALPLHDAARPQDLGNLPHEVARRLPVPAHLPQAPHEAASDAEACARIVMAAEAGASPPDRASKGRHQERTILSPAPPRRRRALPRTRFGLRRGEDSQ